MKNISTLLFGVLLACTVFAQDTVQQDFSAIFSKYEVEGCFALYNEADSQLIQYSSYCDTGYIPASTFKIPHALIVLQEDVIHDTNQVIVWDGTMHDYDKWNKDQNLNSAIKYSCVWAFSSFTNNIAPSIYQDYVNAFDYGNKVIVGPPHMFWLAGDFRISANQQIDFLLKFYHDKLPIDRKNTSLVKDLIILEKTEDYALSGKTGSGRLSDTDYVMWLVGYLEKDGAVYFYAMNFETNNLEKDRSARVQITKDIFTELEMIK